MKNPELFVLLFAIFISAGTGAMSFFSKNTTTLNWEWAANRVIRHKIIIDVIDSGELNEWIKLPSFSANMPDPILLEEKVTRRDFFGKFDIIKLVFPKLELGDVSKGEKLALGLTD